MIEARVEPLDESHTEKYRFYLEIPKDGSIGAKEFTIDYTLPWELGVYLKSLGTKLEEGYRLC